ncbi:MAG: hypothetical protein Q7S05_02785 [bacterium]|nr:hypothetical protein [bacterium]
MEFISRYKWMLLGLGVVVAGFVWYASSGTSTPAALLTTESGGGAVSPVDKSLLENLLLLRAVTLEGTILQDPAFQSLQDFGTQIIAEPIGRSDPFAPLGSSAASQAARSGNAPQLFKPASTKKSP